MSSTLQTPRDTPLETGMYCWGRKDTWITLLTHRDRTSDKQRKICLCLLLLSSVGIS